MNNFHLTDILTYDHGDYTFILFQDEDIYECPKCGETVNETLDYINLIVCPNCDEVFEK